MSHGSVFVRLLLAMISKVGVRPAVTSAGVTASKRETPQQPVKQTRYPDSFFAAEDLGASTRRLAALLGDPPVTASFGARDQWAAVDEAAKPSSKKQDDQTP